MAMTAKELIAKKTDILSRKDATFEVNIKEVGVWKMRTPNAEDIIDSNVFASEHKNEVRNDAVVLVYNMTVEPNLRDAELVKEVAEAIGRQNTSGPWIVDAILKAGEVKNLSDILLEKAGFSPDSVVSLQQAELEGAEQLKNE